MACPSPPGNEVYLKRQNKFYKTSIALQQVPPGLRMKGGTTSLGERQEVKHNT
jgi:hypothetical protein